MKNILFLLCIFCSYALAADWALISAVAGNETAKVLQILNDNPNAINGVYGLIPSVAQVLPYFLQ